MRAASDDETFQMNARALPVTMPRSLQEARHEENLVDFETTAT